LTVTDDDDATDDETHTISVTTNVAPTAAFTFSCAELECGFDGSGSSDSDGSIVEWAWDFGDGSPVDTTSGAIVSHTYAQAGDYTVVLTVTDDDGATDDATQIVSVDVPTTLPLTIQAEDYDTGGQNVGYFDTTGGNTGGAYRTDDVDIQTTSDVGGGFNVGWIANTEWLDYTIDVPTTGSYAITLRLATPNTGRSLRIEIDGTNVSGTVPVPRTGGYQNWADAVVGPINLTAGVHTFRIVAQKDGFNFNHFTIGSAPLTVQAEDYNAGGQNVGYFDTTAGNSGGAYRADDVDIQPTSDVGGGFNVGWIASGEWLDYTVDVPATGNYVITLRLATPNTGRSLRVEVDGTDVSGSVAVPHTGGHQAWAGATVGPIDLTAGTHTIRIVAETDGFNFNFMRLVEQ
jgi:PKD repeat protein